MTLKGNNDLFIPERRTPEDASVRNKPKTVEMETNTEITFPPKANVSFSQEIEESRIVDEDTEMTEDDECQDDDKKGNQSDVSFQPSDKSSD